MSKLYIIPTPIGNLADITRRAVEVLQQIDNLLAEDTRKSGYLLQHLGIQKKMISFHQANEHKRISQVISLLKEGKRVGLVTDAGTPGISDPGYLLVRACLDERIEIECLPGPVAFIPALVLSGFATDRFCFEGFLPHKKGRLTRIQEFIEEKRTLILYESPHRLLKTLGQLCEFLQSDRNISVSRELTKKFEETIRGTTSEVLSHFENHPVKGEFVIVIEGVK